MQYEEIKICKRCNRNPARYEGYCNKCWDKVKPIVRHIVFPCNPNVIYIKRER